MAVVVGLVHGQPGTYGISFPDFPGAVSGGSTLEDVIARGRHGLAVHMEAMIREGHPMPEIRSVETLRAEPVFAEDFGDALAVALLEVELPGRSIRLNISMDERLIDRIDRQAKALGQSRSTFLAAAARHRLSEMGQG